MIQLLQISDALRTSENQAVLKYLDGKQSRSDVNEEHCKSAAPLGDVQYYTADGVGGPYLESFVLASLNAVFAFAVGLNRAGFATSQAGGRCAAREIAAVHGSAA